jgi:hypothetical protein
MVGRVLSRVMRMMYSGQSGGKILHVCVYRDEREGQHGPSLGLVYFRLVVSPLQIEAVGPYLLQSVWFHSRLLLKEIDRIQIYGP